MGTLILRGEKYEVSPDPQDWPVQELMIIERCVGVGVDEMVGGTRLIALGFVAARTLRPKLAWADYTAGLTVRDLDYVPTPEEEAAAEDPPGDGEPAGDAPGSPDDETPTSSD